MMLIVTGIGTLIHLYSIGYMHADEPGAAPSSRSSTCSASRCSCW
jgi:hypothetical protein